MRGLKSIIVISTIIAAAAALSACEKAYEETPVASDARGLLNAAR
jgi:hypothetical protein